MAELLEAAGDNVVKERAAILGADFLLTVFFVVFMILAI
jgi:hypothetical protein